MMLRLTLVGCLLSACSVVTPAAEPAPSESTAPAGVGPTTGVAFPASWVGTWEGSVDVYAPGGSRPGFDMRLEIAPTDDPARYDWITTYTSDGVSQVRDYTLLVRDAQRGEFATDENNGIVLEARYLGDTLHTWFEIGGTRLAVRERLLAAGSPREALSFEIVTAPSDTVVSTGEEGRVESFLPRVMQRALLQRIP